MDEALKSPIAPGQKEVYSSKEVQRWTSLLQGFRLKTSRQSPEDSQKLEKEIVDFDTYLKERYKAGVMEYAMIHALRGSGIDENPKIPISHEDFPDPDSIKSFIVKLIDKYK